MNISQALSRIQPSRTNAMTDRAIALREEGRDIISLSVGEPDFPTPPHVVAAMKDALDAGDTRYTAVAGTAALRRASALHYERDLGLKVVPSQVLVSSGGKQSIFLALMATLNPGDDVLIPAPWWVSYPEIVRFSGASVVPVATYAADGFRLSADALAAAITPKTRWLLLNSPGNPTGATYSAADLQALGEVLRRHPQVLVLSDDIYAPLRYKDGVHATLAVECPDLANRVLTVSGVSKSHAMTGLRIGVAAGPEWLIGAMGRLQSHVSGNACSISQAGAVAAFEGPQEFLLDWREKFRARRDLCVEAINAIPGLSTPIPDGAFYCMIDAAPLMPRFGDDEALAMHLLENGVAIVAASAFGGAHCGFAGFRISFAADEAKLTQAFARIASALK
ncbi:MULTISPECIES: pyridoxal phosphate-dependent aminotransferase [unclassified Novosphingobium]|uniref:pyridoxal phosphate-dependent aminotransferase n=1 Tax=unclassified Novosphingobium TaxID=2644732 RepID=UPI00086AE7C8|nr:MULTISPECIES: pyridoxal phosphate-dependent aminotransferase [unclassified Novosphingobium]MBN9142901.1 pyridoxal phosphate-dependent aminotransferase [Novosphingobium sp.]MDR6705986.1 aspartate aminotransferase [Novosphingobium sp. 1748]ODU84947.1 MAG: aspartate aminotransferase [Novosphingobium sp. SCN 63-17]OJX89273.1 MAG: aspartate aminotransferase [Novosphingobium sp. 63-713]